MLKEPQFAIAGGLIVLTALLDVVSGYALIYHSGIDKDAIGIIGGILGVWHTGFAGAWGYFLGSSHGSQNKDATIAAQATALSVKA